MVNYWLLVFRNQFLLHSGTRHSHKLSTAEWMIISGVGSAVIVVIPFLVVLIVHCVVKNRKKHPNQSLATGKQLLPL